MTSKLYFFKKQVNEFNELMDYFDEEKDAEYYDKLLSHVEELKREYSALNKKEKRIAKKYLDIEKVVDYFLDEVYMKYKDYLIKQERAKEEYPDYDEDEFNTIKKNKFKNKIEELFS